MTTNGPAPELDGLEVGRGFTTPGRTITETDVVSFAALTGDWHPQHADASWAERSRFGRRVAHGMLVLSYAVGLVPLDPTRVIALRGLHDAVFKRPAYIGDTISVEVQVADFKPLDEETALVGLRWKVVNQSGETIARARVEVVWRRDGGEREMEDGEREMEAAEPASRQVFL